MELRCFDRVSVSARNVGLPLYVLLYWTWDAQFCIVISVLQAVLEYTRDLRILFVLYHKYF